MSFCDLYPRSLFPPLYIPQALYDFVLLLTYLERCCLELREIMAPCCLLRKTAWSRHLKLVLDDRDVSFIRPWLAWKASETRVRSSNLITVYILAYPLKITLALRDWLTFPIKHQHLWLDASGGARYSHCAMRLLNLFLFMLFMMLSSPMHLTN